MIIGILAHYFQPSLEKFNISYQDCQKIPEMNGEI